MSDGEPSPQPEAHGEIMDAVHEALLEHGFAALTMQDIADEASVSKSLLHYHYDTKQDLLVAFLDYLVERGEQRAAECDDEPASERLRSFARSALVDTSENDWAFATAILELKAQAPHDETYREQLARNEASLRSYVASIVRTGIETGDFRAVDPEATARLFLAAIDGARTERVALGDDTPQVVHGALLEHVLEPLTVDDESANHPEAPAGSDRGDSHETGACGDPDHGDSQEPGE